MSRARRRRPLRHAPLHGGLPPRRADAADCRRRRRRPSCAALWSALPALPDVPATTSSASHDFLDGGPMPRCRAGIAELQHRSRRQRVALHREDRSPVRQRARASRWPPIHRADARGGAGARLPGLLDGLPRLQPGLPSGGTLRAWRDLGRRACGRSDALLPDRQGHGARPPASGPRHQVCHARPTRSFTITSPTFPMLPGALIVEAAAQLAGLPARDDVQPAGEPLVRALIVRSSGPSSTSRSGPGDGIESWSTLESSRESSAEVAVRGEGRRQDAARGTLDLRA